MTVALAPIVLGVRGASRDGDRPQARLDWRGGRLPAKARVANLEP